MPPEVTQRDEPYAGIANDYSICFLWLGYNLQERMSALDAEIKAATSPDTAGAAGKRAAPKGDTAGLGEKQLTFKNYFDEAIRELDRCVALMPWSMQPIELRQQILLKFHQPKMAEERLRALMGKNPKGMQIRELLGQALEAEGKRAEAESLFEGYGPSGG
jgi:predicted Zn-dependent protease